MPSSRATTLREATERIVFLIVTDALRPSGTGLEFAGGGARLERIEILTRHGEDRLGLIEVTHPSIGARVRLLSGVARSNFSPPIPCTTGHGIPRRAGFVNQKHARAFCRCPCSYL